jgi:hypothetical protein
MIDIANVDIKKKIHDAISEAYSQLDIYFGGGTLGSL